MSKIDKNFKKNKNQYITILFLIGSSVILSYYSFTLFHISIEIYSIIIGFVVFIIVINTHQIILNNYYIFIGIALGYIAVFDLIHVLTCEGIYIFPYAPQYLSDQLWYLGRLIQALTFLISFFFIKNKIKVLNVAYLYTLLTIGSIASLFYFRWSLTDFIPVFIIQNKTFTQEYLILIIVLLTIYLLNKNKVSFSSLHYNNMMGALIFFAISELFFFIPLSVANILKMFAHIARLLSFYFIYKSIIVTGLKEPYNSIFYKMTKTNKKLNDLNQILNIIRDVHETINLDIDLDKLFENIVNNLIKKEDYQMVLIGEYNSEQGIIEIKSSVGIFSEYLNKKQFDLKKDMNAITLSILKRKIIRDNNPLSVYNLFEKKEDSKNNSMIGLPICTDNNIYGVLAIISYKEDAFDNKTCELLNKISDNLGLAISRYYTQKKIEYLSFHDQLTDLYNKNYFMEEIKRLDTSRKLPISIIFSDFNELKKINDKFGHNVGDLFIKSYAEILKENSRQEDIVARWGGDEFVILLPNTNQEMADNLVSRIKTTVDSIVIYNQKLSIAFGVATKKSDNQNIDNIFKKADSNMYDNKKRIKNNN